MSKILVRRLFEQEEELPNVALPKAEYDVMITTGDVDGAEAALNDPKNYSGTFTQDENELFFLKKIVYAQNMSFVKNSFLKLFNKVKKWENEELEKELERLGFLNKTNLSDKEKKEKEKVEKTVYEAAQEKFVDELGKDPSTSKYLKQLFSDKPNTRFSSNKGFGDEMYNVLSSTKGKPFGQFYISSATNTKYLDDFAGKTADTLGYEVKGNTITFPKSLNPKMTNNEIKNKVKKVLDGKVEYRFKGSGAPRNLTKIGTSKAQLKEMIREEILKMLK